MKEASGELSMTAVAVVAIAAIGVVFTMLIWPTIRDNIQRSTHCSQAFNCTGDGEMLTCSVCMDAGCNEINTNLRCPAADVNQ